MLMVFINFIKECRELVKISEKIDFLRIFILSVIKNNFYAIISAFVILWTVSQAPKPAK